MWLVYQSWSSSCGMNRYVSLSIWNPDHMAHGIISVRSPDIGKSKPKIENVATCFGRCKFVRITDVPKPCYLTHKNASPQWWLPVTPETPLNRAKRNICVYIQPCSFLSPVLLTSFLYNIFQNGFSLTVFVLKFCTGNFGLTNRYSINLL